MNCTAIRARLLSLPDPAQPTAMEANHLASCANCRAWHQQLVQVEAVVANLPFEPSDGLAKAQLVEQFRFGSHRSSRPKVPVVPSTPRTPLGERLMKLWPAGLIAAAVLVGSIAFLNLGRKDNGSTVALMPPDPFLEKVVRGKIELDGASRDPGKRLQVLNRLGTDIHEQALALAHVTPGSEMESLARLYSQVSDTIVSEARSLGKGKERESIAQCIQGLTRIEDEANQQAAIVPVGSAKPLKDIARSAKESRTELAQIIQRL